MISEEEARAKVLENVRALPTGRVALSTALNRFAAEELAARLPLPLFDNSAMDGYVVVAGSGKRLRVIGEQPAGADRQLRVSAGETVRIFTGAPIPSGANAVVMQEDVTREGDEIVINTEIAKGDCIRVRGCDLSVGQKILAKGERIRPATLALLASQGFGEVNVAGTVRAGILSTGDELTKPGSTLQSGQIYESNSVLLDALSRKSGANVEMVEHCRDDFDALVAALKRGIEQDVLVVSGGVSVGQHDLVRGALESLGAKIDIWRVAVKPGKPFLFARTNDCLVFGLPGNPVSAYVTFFCFVRPAILKMMGASDANLGLPKVTARLNVDFDNDDERRPHYVRGKFENGNFAPIGRQESHALFGLSQANAVTRVPAGAKLKRGTVIEIEIWE